MPEKVSVLFAVPDRQVENHVLEESERSVTAQSYPQSLIELIQIRYAPGAPRAHASALNAARENATGDLVVHLEPGVIWDAQKVETQVRMLQETEGAAGCVHRMTRRDPEGRTESLDLFGIRSYGPQIGCLLEMPWGPGAGMFIKERAMEAGSYRGVDEVLWENAVRLATRGCRIHPMEEDLAVWQPDPALREGESESHRPLLPAGIRYQFLKSYLDRTKAESLFPQEHPPSAPKARLILAGLFYNNDDLEAAHRLCQEAGRDGPCRVGAYWHGMIHRREPDFENARGCFRKAEGLGAYSEISGRVSRLLQRVMQVPDYGDAREIALDFWRLLQSNGTWDPFHFLALCEKDSRSDNTAIQRFLSEVQEEEFKALFDWTYSQAVGVPE